MEGALIAGIALLLGGLAVAGVYLSPLVKGDGDGTQLWKVSNGFEKYIYVGAGLVAAFFGAAILFG